MKFQITDTFKYYWPPLPDEKFVILEKSILDEGLRENLIVWKEKNILLDGHQRMRVLDKHKIPFNDRITYLSFPDETRAKHWVHITQSARRGDAPQFLSVCHVLEFEPIYREEAKGRQVEAGKHYGKGKDSSSINDTEAKGQFRKFMARDAGAGEITVQRILYIRDHDLKRFKELESKARDGQDISVHLEWEKTKAKVDAHKAGAKIDDESLSKLDSWRTVNAFAETVRKFKPPAHVQKAAAEAIVKNQTTADKNFVEDAIVHRLPKREPKKDKEKSGFIIFKEKMIAIAGFMDKTTDGIKELQELREKFGEDVYFQAIAATPEIRAAFARFTLAAKSFQNGGSLEKKES